MMKRWKLFLFLLAVALLAVAVYRRTVSIHPSGVRPYPSHTFDVWVDDGDWYGHGVRYFSSVNGGMMCTWRGGYDQIADILSFIVYACLLAYVCRGFYKDGYCDGAEDAKSTTKGEDK